MVPISVVYLGGLRCRAQHGPSKVELVTDAPVDNKGRGESFSPSDLVATGLGVCMSTIMGIAAEAHQVAIEGMTVRVEKHMTTTPPRKIAKIVVAFGMPKGIAKDKRPVLEKAAHSCPVALSIHPEIVQEVSFQYPD